MSISWLLMGLCRDAILARKRAEYKDMVPQWYDIAGSSDDDAGALRQVSRLQHMPDLAAVLWRTSDWGVQ